MSNTTYAFHSIAHDLAGNVEAKSPTLIEASTDVPNLGTPTTQFTGTPSANAAGAFTVSFSGTAAAGSEIKTFNVFVQIDGGASVQIASVAAGTAVAGVYSGQTTYQGITDGQSHTYLFSLQGVNASGVQETAHSAAPITATFAAPLAPQVTSFSIEHGAAERSYIRYIDVTFNQPAANLNLSPSTVTLTHYALDGVTSLGTVTLTTSMFTVSGDTLEINFGTGGIGGQENLAATVGNWSNLIADDGYYKLTINPDGSGQHNLVDEFYRLFGNVVGNPTGGATVTGAATVNGSPAVIGAVTGVTSGPAINDQAILNLASGTLLNGDGTGPNTTAVRQAFLKSLGRALASGLHLDD